jgi:SNF2 family DNA or RNA helicase
MNAITNPHFIYSTKPYDHQDEALRKAWLKKGYAYFLEQGTGKSKIIVDEIVNLIERSMINCAVILAPNNVHANWAGEFRKHAPSNNKYEIQIWRSSNKKDKMVEETRQILSEGKALIFLMNIEALSTKAGQEYLRRILLARKDTYMAVDESHKIKTPGAVRTKAVIEMSKLAKYKRIATGTEAEEGIENLYTQFKFLDPNIIGSRSFTAFKSLYCIVGGFENRQIIGYQNTEFLADRIAPFIYQKRKKDCLDLPDKVYVTHEIGMTKEQYQIYAEIEENLLYELESGQLVDATMAITRMMRLQQVLCGHINTTEDKKQSLLVPSNRANYVAEIVEEASGKVIIFCRFIKDVDLIITALSQAGLGAVGVSSFVEASERAVYIDRWRNDVTLKVLAITTATGGTGLTLNEATTTIFYSNNWSSTDRLQAEDRNHRIGQDNKVTYHDIVVPNKVDDRLLRVLKSKQMNASKFRSIVDVKRFLTGEM